MPGVLAQHEVGARPARPGRVASGRRGCRSAWKPAQDLAPAWAGASSSGDAAHESSGIRAPCRNRWPGSLHRRTLSGVAGILRASVRAGRAAPTAPPEGGKVAILLPLTGARAEIGQALLQSAQLALAAPGSPTLVSQDTGGSPEGAAAAARAALGSGATLILGPLTAPEVAAMAPIARGANVPVLAFSNDPAVAQPGVWPLGITPGQQVGRMVGAAQSAGKSRLAAMLPDSDFGHAMGSALSQAAATAGLAPPTIRFHGPGMSAINQGVRALSDYDARWAPVQEQIRAARAEGTSEGRRKADQLSRTALPPPPFDALLLGDTGEALTELAAVLPYYFVTRPAVQIMGPSLWADRAAAPDSSAVPGMPRPTPPRAPISLPPIRPVTVLLRRAWRTLASMPPRSPG